MIFREDYYVVYLPYSDGFLTRNYCAEQSLDADEVYMFKSVDELDEFTEDGNKTRALRRHLLSENIVVVPVHKSTIDGSLFPLYHESWYFNIKIDI